MSGASDPAAIPLAEILARWEALAIRWGLTAEERSSLLGAIEDGPVADVSTYRHGAAEARMRLHLELEPVLVTVLVDEGRIRDWLRRGNRQLGGGTPIEVMASSPAWIRWLIDSLGVAA